MDKQSAGTDKLSGTRAVVTRRDGSFTPFQPGNKFGYRGAKKNPLTQTLLAQMSEVDERTGKEKMHALCEALYKCAVGYTDVQVIKDAKGKVKEKIETKYQPDITAINTIFDRIEGKAKQQHEITSENRTEVIYRSADEIRKEFAARGLLVNGTPLELVDVVEDHVTIDNDGNPV